MIMDAEDQQSSREDADDEKCGFVRAERMCLPLRKRHVVSDILKMVLSLAILAYVYCSLGSFLVAAFFLVSVADLSSCRIIGESLLDFESPRWQKLY